VRSMACNDARRVQLAAVSVAELNKYHDPPNSMRTVTRKLTEPEEGAVQRNGADVIAE
jgi:hypothetical protein